MYAYFRKLDYFSTECVYAPNAYRGFARSYLKDLEAIRPSAIIGAHQPTAGWGPHRERTLIASPLARCTCWPRRHHLLGRGPRDPGDGQDAAGADVHAVRVHCVQRRVQGVRSAGGPEPRPAQVGGALVARAAESCWARLTCSERMGDVSCTGSAWARPASCGKSTATARCSWPWPPTARHPVRRPPRRPTLEQISALYRHCTLDVNYGASLVSVDGSTTAAVSAALAGCRSSSYCLSGSQRRGSYAGLSSNSGLGDMKAGCADGAKAFRDVGALLA